jgi:hypothetical protein
MVLGTVIVMNEYCGAVTAHPGTAYKWTIGLRVISPGRSLFCPESQVLLSLTYKGGDGGVVLCLDISYV